MRLLLVALLISVVPAVAAAQQGLGPREAYVERRGLIELDSRCRLLSPSIAGALDVGVAQARGSLLRAGWTSNQVLQLDQAVVSSARARTCTDARTTSAAENARRAFGTWANLGTMQFPGWERTWVARRSAISIPWRLSQSIDAPVASTFGVLEHDGAQSLTLALDPQAGRLFTAARLLMRDPRHTPAPEISLPQRMGSGLEAGAPSPVTAQTVTGQRSADREAVVFTFPDTAFRDLLQLDPRESVVIELSAGRATQRILVEVGDIAAARAFLTLDR